MIRYGFWMALAATVCLVASCAHGLQAKAPSQGRYVWRNVKIVAGGFVDGIVFNPAAKDVVYARTDIGGAYRWNPAAKCWIPLLDWLGPDDWNLTGVESIGIDQVDANRVYLAVGTYTNNWAGNGAIFRSDDQGRTWRQTRLPFKNGGNEDGRSAGERLAVDPSDDRIVYFGSRNNGLWKSGDFGATWNQVGTFPVQGRTNGVGVVFEVFQAASGRRGVPTPMIYAGVSQDGPSLYRSADAGVTWTPVAGQPARLLPHHAVLARDGMLYLTYADAPGPNGMSAGAVWKLDTHSGVWTDVSPIRTGQPGASGYAGLAVDPEHPNTVMVSTMDRWSVGDTVFRSADGGRTWNDIRPKSMRDWSLSPYVTFGAATASFGWWIGALAVDPFRPGHVLYGTGATIWATDDMTAADQGQPTHWFIGADGIEETAVLALISPPQGPPLVSGLGDIGGFVHGDLTISPPGGMMENPRASNISSVDFAGQAPRIIARVNDGRPGGRGGISDDGGASWTPFPAEPVGSAGRGVIAVSADGKVLVWSQDHAAPAFSRDRGATWTACAGLPPQATVVSDRVDPSRFYAYDGDQGTVEGSTDGGADFHALAPSPVKGDGRVQAAPDAASDLWLTVNGSLYHAPDGTTFADIPTITGVRSLGFGKAALGASYPALFALGVVGGLNAIYRSDDAGRTWQRINDDQRQYATADLIVGDPRVYGRAYVGTNGRGILYGDVIPQKLTR